MDSDINKFDILSMGQNLETNIPVYNDTWCKTRLMLCENLLPFHSSATLIRVNIDMFKPTDTPDTGVRILEYNSHAAGENGWFNCIR